MRYDRNTRRTRPNKERVIGIVGDADISSRGNHIREDPMCWNGGDWGRGRGRMDRVWTRASGRNRHPVDSGVTMGGRARG